MRPKQRRLGRAPLPAPSASVPAYLAAVGNWSNISGSALTSSGAGWSGTSPGGTTNYQGIITAWGGGVMNTVGIWRGGNFVAGTFKIIWGGGHGDYGGIDMYGFGPLESDTPTWSRITDPLIPAADDVQRSGGYPVSRHTYDTLVYLPTTNQMLCIGAPGYFHTGNTYNIADIFDFDTDPGSGNPWSTADTDFPAFNGGGTGTIDLLSAYNPTTGTAWGLGKGNSQRLGRYTVATGEWDDWAIDNPNSGVGRKAAIDPDSNVLAYVSGGTIFAVDLRTPTATVYSPSATGTGPAGKCMLEWDAAAGNFVGWTGTGKTVYFLTPGANPYSGGDAWAWTSDTPAGGDTPTTETTNGTYSRMRLAVGDGWRALFVVPTPGAAVSHYRIA